MKKPSEPRHLTDAEKTALRTGCIFCKGEEFLLGPQALGLSFNIYCCECRAGYNITHVQLPWQVISAPKEKKQKELDALFNQYRVMMDIETMLTSISNNVEYAVRKGFEEHQAAKKSKH